MAKAVISLDEDQVTKLEQVIIDHDEAGAFELLHAIRQKVRTYLDPRCGIEKLRKPIQ
jgi:hypothetical protein